MRKCSLFSLAALGLLGCLAPAPARADFHLGFLHWTRSPRPVTLQSQMPAAQYVTCATPIAAPAMVAAPSPQPVSVHLQLVPAAPPAVTFQAAPVPAAPVMLQAAPAAPPPDRYYLLKIDGATGAASIAPATPR